YAPARRRTALYGSRASNVAGSVGPPLQKASCAARKERRSSAPRTAATRRAYSRAGASPRHTVPSKSKSRIVSGVTCAHHTCRAASRRNGRPPGARITALFEAVLLGGEPPAADLFGERPGRVLEDVGDLGVALDEPRGPASAHP